MIEINLTPRRDSSLGWPAVEAEFPYSEAIIANLKLIPGIRWDPKKRVWWGPDEAWEAAEPRLVKVAVMRWFHNEAIDIAQHAFDIVENDNLRRYQRDAALQALSELSATGGHLLALEMGLGKTATAIAISDALVRSDDRILILCPAIAISHWENQLTKWGTRFSLSAERDESGNCVEDYGDYRVNRFMAKRHHVMSYDAWRSKQGREWRERFEAPPLLILDEIHYLADPSTKRSEAVADYLEANPQVMRLGLSGTPMTAKPDNLWHPLNLLHPGRWGKRYSFQSRYCNGHYEELKIGSGTKAIWVADGKSNLEELHLRLKRVASIASRKEVAAEMPPLTRQLIEVEAKNRVPLTGGMSIAEALAAAEAEKIDAAVELAQNALAAGSRPLLVAHRRATIERLSRMLNCVAVNGDVPPAERAPLLRGADCGAATIDSITTAIDLETFDVIIFAGLDWLPSKLLQAESRLMRLGRLTPVTAYYLIANGSADEAVRNRVIDRLDDFAAVTGLTADGLNETLAGGDEDELLRQLIADCMAA